MRLPLILAAVLVPLCALASTNDVLMSITGEKQGAFKSAVARDNSSTDQITLTGMPRTMPAPRQMKVMPEKGKHHQNLLYVVTKRVDWSSPMMNSALVNNEVLPTVVFNIYYNDGKNRPELMETITLTNATITNIKQERASTARARTPQNVRALEEVTFTFEKIQDVHVPPVAK